jgi:GT2 family glycosyltransferase
MQLTINNTSFVIVSYNNFELLNRCIQSINVQTGPFNIIVIDNNSDKECIEQIKKIEGIELIVNLENVGFGKACNLGMDLALKNNSTFVYLLNQDARLDKPEHLLKLTEVANDNKSIALLSPLQLEKPGQFEYNFSGFLKKNKVVPSFSGDRVYEVDFVNAASWFIKVREIETRFDPDFFMYGEDHHFTKVIKKAGFKIGIYEGCSVFHPKEKKYEDDPAINQKVHFGYYLSEWKIPIAYNSKLHLLITLIKKCLKNTEGKDGWAWFYFKTAAILFFRLYKL